MMSVKRNSNIEFWRIIVFIDLSAYITTIEHGDIPL